MIKEALQYIETQTKSGLDIKVVEELSDDIRVALRMPDGTFEIKEKAPPSRCHEVFSIESLLLALGLFKSDHSSLWVSLNRIILVIDHSTASHRRDMIEMELIPSPAFQTLGETGWVKQKVMVDRFRHDFHNVEIGPQNTLDVIRNLKFSTQMEQSGRYTADTAAMGKSIASQVTGEDKIPETVSFEFPPYPGLAEEVEGTVIVFCTLFTEPEQGLLRLVPKTGQLEEAKRKAQLILATHLREQLGDSAPVFLGRP